jgi:hypothetical protein
VPELVYDALGFTAFSRAAWLGGKLSHGGDTLPL